MTPDRLTRRTLLAGALSGLAGHALAQPPETSLRPMPNPGGGRAKLAPEASDLVAAAELGAEARVGFALIDARTGKMLEAMNPDLPLPPASTAKALTASYALDALGPDFIFETRVIATGPVRDGRLEGDLVLAGSGDPTLDTDRLAELAAGVKAAGVVEVTGRFLVWSGALPSLSAIEPDQPAHVGYNPGLSGLNLNYNRVHFEWRRAGSGYSVDMDARSGTHRPPVTMAQMSVVDRGSPVYTYADEGDVEAWTVAGGALGNGGSRWLPVRHSAAYTAEVFQTFARANGIVLDTPVEVSARPGGTVLAQVRSQPLREMLRDMLKWSTNLTAETIGLTASTARGERPGSLAASAGRMCSWVSRQVPGTSPALLDHSGLGTGSRISAADMARALARLGPAVDLAPILKTMPLVNERREAMARQVPIFAKTGTLNFVSALTGFVELPGGRPGVFSILTADTGRRAALSREQMEQPPGGAYWASRSRNLQMRLIERWADVHHA
ncbi:D-alanyl-D-alanine carboxypeptidase/D-alanyl-D-alanine-endopeptidase [Roseicyclus sp. F158]|uniref:D-alanyl-D-alanine carboxypeptidase/D-alanyl-D-alanine-endopeptidase n=1 Tax=Tropicimonas omnivorans TaxID=3075590 RepID=A0ABU3DEC9_9RHOB|nr:D-alanyl-D-alanine carboxypeptidase/D-alanyl-D-alanine-endopeptidase [Roseicyclus sp. F158]MDT0682037.1 D-alanyl-D-alanine carboxypeptidase/D-alanyl-D-alanine-endopeptidase [Roseicyclus sp. F158]